MQNHHQAHIYVPDNVWDKLSKLAKENRRSVSSEIVIAIEKRLDRLDAERRYAKKKRNGK